jgi:hypothetical protein
MRFRRCVGTLLLASSLTACGSRTSGGFHPSGQVPSGDHTTTSSGGGTQGTSSTAPAGDPTAKTPQSALAAYKTYQRVYEQIYETGNAAPLNSVAIDPQLSLITKDLASVQAQGVIWRFHNVLNPRIQGRSADDSTVVILDCVQTLGAYRFSAKTGKRLSAWRGGNYLYQAIMRFADGSWKISEARQGRKC